MSAECNFYILNREDPDESHSLWVDGHATGSLILDDPPAVGDLIALSGRTETSEGPTVAVTGMWRVLARQWSPPAFGSPVWRTGDRPTAPIWLDVMLEQVEGMFARSHYERAEATGSSGGEQ